MKTVQGITMTSAGRSIVNPGTATADGKYVASVYARFTGQKEHTPSRNNPNVKTKSVMRFDIGVFELDKNGKQGDDVIPYCQMRFLDIISSFGQSLFPVGIDNESTRRFKNLVVGAKIWDAIKADLKRAVKDAVTRELSGETTESAAATSELVADIAADFAKAAESAEKRMAEVRANQQSQELTQEDLAKLGDSPLARQLKAQLGLSGGQPSEAQPQEAGSTEESE